MMAIIDVGIEKDLANVISKNPEGFKALFKAELLDEKSINELKNMRTDTEKGIHQLASTCIGHYYNNNDFYIAVADYASEMERQQQQAQQQQSVDSDQPAQTESLADTELEASSVHAESTDQPAKQQQPAQQQPAQQQPAQQQPAQQQPAQQQPAQQQPAQANSNNFSAISDIYNVFQYQRPPVEQELVNRLDNYLNNHKDYRESVVEKLPLGFLYKNERFNKHLAEDYVDWLSSENNPEHFDCAKFLETIKLAEELEKSPHVIKPLMEKLKGKFDEDNGIQDRLNEINMNDYMAVAEELIANEENIKPHEINDMLRPKDTTSKEELNKEELNDLKAYMIRNRLGKNDMEDMLNGISKLAVKYDEERRKLIDELKGFAGEKYTDIYDTLISGKDSDQEKADKIDAIINGKDNGKDETSQEAIKDIIDRINSVTTEQKKVIRDYNKIYCNYAELRKRGEVEIIEHANDYNIRHGRNIGEKSDTFIDHLESVKMANSNWGKEEQEISAGQFNIDFGQPIKCKTERDGLHRMHTIRDETGKKNLGTIKFKEDYIERADIDFPNDVSIVTKNGETIDVDAGEHVKMRRDIWSKNLKIEITGPNRKFTFEINEKGEIEKKHEIKVDLPVVEKKPLKQVGVYEQRGEEVCKGELQNESQTEYTNDNTEDNHGQSKYAASISYPKNIKNINKNYRNFDARSM